MPSTLLSRPDVDAAATRRQFLSMLAAAGLLGGCAGDDDRTRETSRNEFAFC